MSLFYCDVLEKLQVYILYILFCNVINQKRLNQTRIIFFGGTNTKKYYTDNGESYQNTENLILNKTSGCHTSIKKFPRANL